MTLHAPEFIAAEVAYRSERASADYRAAHVAIAARYWRRALTRTLLRVRAATQLLNAPISRREWSS